MGARPMYRIIQDKIKKPLAEELIFGELSKNGGSVIVTVEDDELKIDLNESSTRQPRDAHIVHNSLAYLGDFMLISVNVYCIRI